jgi:hypothetical protein
MAFSSTLYPGEIIINDTEGLQHCVPPDDYGTGLSLPFFRVQDRHYEGAAEPFPEELLIPESDWQGMIQEQEERKSRLSDIVNQAGLPCKDQNGTNYCWINAPVHCIEIMRLLQNQETVILSPASAGAPIKGFRNVGGWGLEGLRYLQDNGCCPVEKWPANAIDRKYYTEENKALARYYRQLEWWELRPRNTKQLVSCLLRRIPVAVGLNWWGHEVTYYEPVWLDGTVAIRQRNSWGLGWGTQGYGILQGSRFPADDAVAARTVLPS